ncbi:hypothetical protein Tco_1198176, partial [Tanacetum coccineum]
GFSDIGNLFYTHSPCTPFAATAINNKEEQSHLFGYEQLRSNKGAIPSNIEHRTMYNSDSIACADYIIQLMYSIGTTQDRKNKEILVASSNKSEVSTAIASDKLEGSLLKFHSEAHKSTAAALSASDPILMPSQDS